MQPIELLVREQRGVNRKNYMIEQGIPVRPMSPDEVRKLGIFDEAGNQVPADIQIEGTDHEDKVRWVLVSFPVDVLAGDERKFLLKESNNAAVADGRLESSASLDNTFIFRNRFFTVEFTNPGIIRLSTSGSHESDHKSSVDNLSETADHGGLLLDGQVSFELRSDARSAVGNLRPVEYEPLGFEVLERSDRRAKILLRGRYKAWAPKRFYFDPVQRYDADVEFTVYADSPVIRLRWCITNHMKFNCSYMWLDRYLLSLPLVEDSIVIEGAEVPDENKFAEWVTLRTPGGKLSMAFPFYSWLGKGAGIEVKDGRLACGGVNPPPDGGFGGKNPDIWRKFYYGMSRTFEASLIVGGSHDQILAELNHIPIVVPPKHYSDCGVLPENGSEITFGPWEEPISRAAEYLLDSQWKGTLWFGEWWRERDVDHDLGVEETNSGNSALGPLYHFFRTGDWRFWESAKMSYLYTYDIQFCKREDGYGPYMHTRRFLLDHQEWFHPRYQRVGGMIRCSHLFGDKRYRDKVIWMLKFWGENYVAEDGSPMVPNSDGTKSKCTESAMSNFTDSLMYAYIETKDSWFLDKAKLIGDWVVRGAEANLDKFCENSNSTRYILCGLLQLCMVTGEQRYIDTFVKIAKWTVNAPTFDYGTHYVAFHFYYASQAYKWSGDKSILEGILRLAEWVLSKEAPDAPGTYPFPQRNQYPPANWICIYDNKAIVSYLPVLASALAESGMLPAS